MKKEVLVKRLGDLFYLPSYRNDRYSLYHRTDEVLIYRILSPSVLVITKRGTIYCTNETRGKGIPNKLSEMYEWIKRAGGVEILFS